MNPAAYLEMAEAESSHWWFCGRRVVLAAVMQNLHLPRDAKILEVGCGTGGNLDILAEFGGVSAFEMDDNARAIAASKTDNRYELKAGHCPDAIPFQGRLFDLICMFDVLEHIEQDTETLAALKRLLSVNGRILITVPAYQWLFGSHDRFLHHKRRYAAGELRQKIAAAGLVSEKLTYFNTLLFPLAAAVRLKDKLLGSASPSGTGVPPSPINALFKAMFGSERFLLQYFNLPFGVSLLCVLKAAEGTPRQPE